MIPLLLKLLLMTSARLCFSTVEGMAVQVGESIVPSFSLQELLLNQRSEEFATILKTTGLLTIESSSFNSMFRHAALDGLCRCENQLLQVENSDTALLDDGSTVRKTVATATAGNTPRPLPTNLAQHCGLDTATSMEQIRDEVAVVADAFVGALDRFILSSGNNNYSSMLLRDSKGLSYDRVASIVKAGNHLEHFHVYSKKTATEESSLDWHTDAGLFLAFVPALNCRESTSGDHDADESFWFKDENGVSTRAIFQPNSIAIMLGAGVEHWLQSPVPLRATRHAVTMRKGDERAWYGMSKCHQMDLLSIFVSSFYF